MEAGEEGRRLPLAQVGGGTSHEEDQVRWAGWQEDFGVDLDRLIWRFQRSHHDHSQGAAGQMRRDVAVEEQV